jgi:SAM-dependent methyltransferase
VTPGLWDYLHQEELAANYLATIGSSPVITADEVWVARHVGMTGRVLDLGCGPGRSLLPLARRGLACVGVDLSAAMLDQAAQAAARVGVRLELVRANIVTLECVPDACFDHVLCLFSTLGMIHPAAARWQVLQNAWRVLRPGGRLLLHVHNRWFQRRQQGWSRLVWEWLRTLAGAEPLDEPMPHHQGVSGLMIHGFTLREIRALLQQANFDLQEVTMLGLSPDGLLRWPRWCSTFRAHGYLLAASKPPDSTVDRTK